MALCGLSWDLARKVKLPELKHTGRPRFKPSTDTSRGGRAPNNASGLPSGNSWGCAQPDGGPLVP
jgi:hypothetical protein